MPAKHVGQLCKRCNILEAALTVRAEPLCRDCFARYLHTKVVKRMDAFRTRHAEAGQQRKLLLPISFGVSSVTLLHVLTKHLKIQVEKTGRTGFSLQVLHIKSTGSENYTKQFDLLKKAFSEHEYSTTSLEDLFTRPEHLQELLGSLPSSSSLADILSILRTRSAVQFALANGCEAVFWSNSTTSLAETILSATAKGRGFALPHLISDGPTPYGISFHFPLRDVLRKELVSHAKLVEPSLLEFMDPKALEGVKMPVSGKNASIDGLMGTYFEEVEDGYPSIVSNVVKTAGKLQSRGEGREKCRLCGLVVEEGMMGIAGWGGYQEDSGGEQELCFGCSRSLPAELIRLLP
jgi:cytoplasmic tRNA 2-thiolation protein 2